MPSPPVVLDRDLVVRFARADREAFLAVYQAYASALRPLVTRFFPRPFEPEGRVRPRGRGGGVAHERERLQVPADEAAGAHGGPPAAASGAARGAGVMIVLYRRRILRAVAGDLSAAQETRLRAHLRGCAACRG